jgi:hypothetical protein
MAAAMAVAMVGAAPSVANWFSSTISPAMIGNGPIIELHFGTAKLAVLGGSATHSGAPPFESTCTEFSAHDFDYAGFCHTGPFKNCLKRGSIFPCHLNHSRDIPKTEGR